MFVAILENIFRIQGEIERIKERKRNRKIKRQDRERQIERYEERQRDRKIVTEGKR